MTLTYKDIEVFILTYNRCELLVEALRSILSQSVGPCQITVIDNASTDATEDVINNIILSNTNIRYVRNKENMGSEYSYNLAGGMCEKALMMCFHDDDILHPKYIETALKYFNTIKNLCILSTDCHTPQVIDNRKWEDVSTTAIYYKDYIEFASYLYYENSFAYPAVIYRTKAFKETFFSKKPYGKIDDKIRCIEICKKGSAVIFQDKNFLRYRQHSGQDSNNKNSGPYLNEIINFNKYFKEILCANIFSINYILFNIRNYDWIYFLYFMGGVNIEFNNYIKICLKMDACTLLTSKCHHKFFYKLRNSIKKRIHPTRCKITI